MRISILSFSIAGALVFATVAAGCGTDDGSSDDPCAGYVGALSDFAGKCNLLALSESTQSQLRESCQRIRSAPGISPDFGAALASCTSDIANATCREGPECEPPNGTLPNGAACGDDLQCQSGFCKVTAPDETYCGTCAATAKVGEACSPEKQCEKNASCVPYDDTSRCEADETLAAGSPCSLGDECADGTVCRGDSDARTCQPPAKAGEPCSLSRECDEGLTCGSDRTCAPAGTEGEACTLGSCAAGFDCDLSTKKCAKIVSVKTGEPCDMFTRRCIDGTCEGASLSGSGEDPVVTPGTCTAYLAEGAACSNLDDGPNCAPLARCLKGVCTTVDPATCK